MPWRTSSGNLGAEAEAEGSTEGEGKEGVSWPPGSKDVWRTRWVVAECQLPRFGLSQGQWRGVGSFYTLK